MRCTISQIYFGKELYMLWTDLLSIIRSFNNVYTAIGVCHASYVDCLLVRSGFHPDLTSRQSSGCFTAEKRLFNLDKIEP